MKAPRRPAANRVREHMQWMFVYGISNAAIQWARRGQDPTEEWAELYDYVIHALAEKK